MNVLTPASARSPATAASSSGLSSIASPTKTSAPTFGCFASSRAWASTLRICVSPAPYADPAHERAESLPAGNELRGAAFVEAAIVNELHVEPTELFRDLEHSDLQRLRKVPGRLSAHCGVKREDQPSATRRADGRRRSRAASTNAATCVAAAGSDGRHFLVSRHFALSRIVVSRLSFGAQTAGHKP